MQSSVTKFPELIFVLTFLLYHLYTYIGVIIVSVCMYVCVQARVVRLHLENVKK
jgi:hypothetical protein